MACQTIEKVPEIADYELYLDDHGFPVTTIRPRPIVAAASAVHTDWSGAPLGIFRMVFKA